MEKGMLPVGVNDFEALRRDGQIYVDKTDLIFKLASKRGKVFLARPPHFGKTLLTSTFESLFKNGLKYFDGLKIDGKWDDRTYRVIRLDFSEVKDEPNIKAMKRSFDDVLRAGFERVGFVYDEKDYCFCIDQIFSWLDSEEISGFALLIDEYDAPLRRHLDDPVFFKQISSMLETFFSYVKSHDRAWRFIFITGVSKLFQSSIFSCFNIMENISLRPKYGTLLGYTESEILENFKPLVENAAKANGMDVPTLMAAMQAQYGGFCFDEDASTQVYAPWSVLNFFEQATGGLKHFWHESAEEASMVTKCLNFHPLKKGNENFDEDVHIALEDLTDNNDAETLSSEVFLFQNGYLTLKRTTPYSAYLNFPNEEAREAMKRRLADQLAKK